MHLPVFNQFFKFSPKTIEVSESNPRIMEKGPLFFTMATVGGSGAEYLPAKHASVGKIPHRRKLNPVPSAQPQNKEHRGVVQSKEQRISNGFCALNGLGRRMIATGKDCRTADTKAELC